jgi:formiminotetrahydrofolate cyclodeaminase
MNSLMQSAQNPAIQQRVAQIAKVKQMYRSYQQNPEQFVTEYIAQNPQLKQILSSVSDPQAAFEHMLDTYGITKEQYHALFK